MKSFAPGMRKLAVWLVLWTLVACVQGGFVEPPPSLSLRSLTEAETRLPCLFSVQEGQVVVQVTWTREGLDGTKEQIITGLAAETHPVESGRFAGRVRFESGDPTANSALLILHTDESDEGTYTCHIATYPSGNFERQLSLTVWIAPISSIDAVVLLEGQSFGLAASCRSVARPPPRLSWDTDLPGLSQNRSSDGRSVSSQFSLHPLRSMNGKRLDCLVWHPALERPRRLSNNLVVQYPPDVTISGYDGHWFIGMSGAELRCDSGGNPKPQNFTWTRRGGALPESASVDGAKLLFGQPISPTDAGLYQCVATNSVGTGRADLGIRVAAERAQREVTFDHQLIFLVIGVAVALLLVMIVAIILVNRNHRRRNRKLEMELTEKKEEINNLSRQTSFRRLNSVGTDPRVQPEDCKSCKSEIKNSLSSLQDHSIRKDRDSRLDGKETGEQVGVDYLGPLSPSQSSYCDGREGSRGTRGEQEEYRLRVESYLKNSNMTLKPQNGGGEPGESLPLRPGGGSGGGTEVEDWGQRPGVLEGDDDNSAYQITEALSNPFHYSNGLLQPKAHPNGIPIHLRRQII